MKTRRWICACATAIFLFITGPTIAKGQGNGNGHGHAYGHDKHHGDSDDRDDYYHRDGYPDEMRGWYHDHDSNLPPGLAKKDRLPPGLEKQLVARGTLPPGLQKRIEPFPEDLERRLPPPPPDYSHVVIGGHIVLVNKHNWMILDVFHFER